MPESPEHIEVEALAHALLALDKFEVRRILAQAADVFQPIQIIEKLAAPAMKKIGEQWSLGKVSLSQVYMSGRICEEFISPIVFSEGAPIRNQPAIAIAVLEDYHSLGKKIVAAFLRANGFKIIDYGHMTVDELVRQTLKDNISVLLLSTLMLPSALKVKTVRQRLNAEAASATSNCKVKVVVGGAPFLFDTELWKEVQADAMGRNASEAIDVINGIMGRYDIS